MGRIALWSAVNCYLLVLLFDALQMSLQADVKMCPEIELIARTPFFQLEIVVLGELFRNIFILKKVCFLKLILFANARFAWPFTKEILSYP